METSATSSTGEVQGRVGTAVGATDESEMSVDIGIPIVVALALLAACVAAGFAIAIAAGWHPL